MLKLTDISKAFVHQTVLEAVNLHVGAKSRIGLIGRNGCGKSTLLRIMMGQMEYDSGSIYRAPGLRINSTQAQTLEIIIILLILIEIFLP